MGKVPDDSGTSGFASTSRSAEARRLISLTDLTPQGTEAPDVAAAETTAAVAGEVAIEGGAQSLKKPEELTCQAHPALP
jgi:hypothetical protein